MFSKPLGPRLGRFWGCLSPSFECSYLIYFHIVHCPNTVFMVYNLYHKAANDPGFQSDSKYFPGEYFHLAQLRLMIAGELNFPALHLSSIIHCAYLENSLNQLSSGKQNVFRKSTVLKGLTLSNCSTTPQPQLFQGGVRLYIHMLFIRSCPDASPLKPIRTKPNQTQLNSTQLN